MKKILFALLALTIISTGKIYSQKFTKAIDYMGYVEKEFRKIMEDNWDYTSAAAHSKSARSVESKRKDLTRQMQSSISRVEKMPDFNGNTRYRDSIASFLKINLIVMNEDYGKIVDMEEVAEQSYDAMEAFLLAKDLANEKLSFSASKMSAEHKMFAADNTINLIEGNDKTEKMLAEASKVYKYYNEIYLIFFKSYKQELFMVDAQNKMDINSMEQNRNSLMKNSGEGIKKINEVPAFKGDVSIKKACLEMLKFYQEEAEKKYTDVSNYFLEKEKYEKMKAAFEGKNSRSKEDVDQINKSLSVFNGYLEKYNKTNQELNNERNNLLNSWNNTCTKFIDKQVPKKK